MARWGLVALLFLGLGRASMGQAVAFGMAGFDLNAPVVTVAEAERLAADADLGEPGKAAAKSLVEAYSATAARLARQVTREMERAQISVPWTEREKIQELYRQASAARASALDAAGKSVLGDLRAMVPEEKLDAWFAFERRRHRRMYLPQSLRTGVRPDLVDIAERAQVDRLPDVREVLAPYELELDRLLLARYPVALEADEKLEEAMQAGNEAEAERIYNAVRDADCAVLQLQRSSGRRLIDATPAEKRVKVQGEILAGRMAFRNTHPPVRRDAEKLLKLGRLAPEARAVLQAALDRYIAQDYAIDDRYTTRQEDQECATSYAKSRERYDSSNGLEWMEMGRQAQAELLAVIDRVASQDDLDSLESTGSAAEEP
jgi:hypothetical protein